MDQYNLDDNLSRIRELTQIVTPIIEMSNIIGSKVKYEILKGKCEGTGLHNDGKVAIQMAWLDPDTVFTNHDHEEIEILIVHEGKMTVNMKDKTFDLEVGGLVKFEPKEAHLLETKEGCKLIAITIPASKGYPHGR